MKKISYFSFRRVLATIWLSVFLSALLLAAPGRYAGENRVVLAQAPEAAPVITVNLTQTRGKIDAHAFGIILGNKGMDVPELSYFFRNDNGKQDLTNLGVRTMYYWVDRDDWAHPYSSFTAEPEPESSVMHAEEFLSLSNTVGAEPMISVNITNLCERDNNSLPYSPSNVKCKMATKADAKAFLAHVKAYAQSQGVRDVKYVFLGVEPYAGCPYWTDGINCTTRNNEHKIQLTQQEYAKRVLAWTKALRQVDSKIQVGVQLLPNAFICETSCNGVSWDETVLKQTGNKVDFLVTHQYFSIDELVPTEAAAEKYSYYQEQTDYRVDKQGVTAMPKQIRKELLKWLPLKKNMPIFVGEFNAGRADYLNAQASVDTRMALYSGMSLAEAYLDSIAPLKYKKVMYPGATRLILLNLWSLPVMIAHYLPLDNPTTLVKSPGWYLLSALRELQGKTWVTVGVKNNPSTPVGRPALRAYAVKQGKDVWLVVFNHSATTAQTANVNFIGTTPVSATMTVVGDTASGFLTQNTAADPNRITPATTNIPNTKIKSDHLEDITFAAHSLTVIKLDGN